MAVLIAPAAGAGESPLVFVCYSHFQKTPDLLPLAEAVALGERPYDPVFGISLPSESSYWQPVALNAMVPPNLRDGLPVGPYTLSCANNLPIHSLLDTDTSVGTGGEAYDGFATAAYRRAGDEALGIYPVFAWQGPVLETGGGGCFLSVSSCAAPRRALRSGNGWSEITPLWVAYGKLKRQRWPQRQQSAHGSGYTFAIYATRRGAQQFLRTLTGGAASAEDKRLVARFDFAHNMLAVIFRASADRGFEVASLRRENAQLIARVDTHLPANPAPASQSVVTAVAVRVSRSWLHGRLPRYARVDERGVADDG